MIHFIYGASGSGKSHKITEYIARDIENGIPSFLIVPEQESVAVEKKMLTLFPASAQLSVEVLNFSRLCNRIFRAYGSLSYNFASAGIKSLLMWNNLRALSPLLCEYRLSDITDLSLTQRMLSAVAELKAYGVSPLKLENTLSAIEENTPLHSKIKDISLIYAAYSNKMEETFSDSADDLVKARKILEKHNFFGGINVYIDSFTDFTKVELDMIGDIMRLAENTYITIGIPKPHADGIHFERILESEKSLRKLCNGFAFEDIILEGNKRQDNAELAYFSESIWSFDAPKYENELIGAITPCICENPYSEAEFIASKISKEVRSGTKYGEIAVIARDAEKYRGIIDTVFEKYNIPFYMSEKTDIMTKPLIKFLFSALKIKESNWQIQNVISHLKTGFTDISPDEIDIFEDYITTWNIKGNRFFDEAWTMNPDGFAASLSERGKHILTVANSVKNRLVPKLARFFAELDASESTTEMCKAVFDFLESSNVTQRVREIYLSHIDQGDKKAAMEDLSFYKATLEILYSVSSAIGEEALSFAEFSSALSIVFSQSNIGTIPTGADEVLIGSASMLRTHDTKLTFVMGLNEGEFPQAVNDCGIFSDSDKEKLSELGIKLSASNEGKACEELYYLYKSISTPNKALVLTSTSFSSDGKSQRPSSAFERIKVLFPSINIQTEKALPISDKLWTKEIATEYYPQLKDKALGLSLKETLGEELTSRFDTTSVIAEKCRVSEENIKRIFGERISLTQSRLEKYVLCGFDYYCTYVLRLRENKKATFRLNDIGTFIHAILEKFMKEATKNGSLNLSLTDSEIDEILERAVGEYLNELLGERLALSNRTKHLFLRLKRLSTLIVRNIMKEFSDSSFYPAHFELKIGFEGGIDALSFNLKDGSTVSIRGVADRVDLYREGENTYVRVIDYKTGSKEFSLDDVKEGLNTQLLLYLFTICKSERQTLNGTEAGHILPAGIQYLSSNIPSLSIESACSDEKIALMAQEELSRKGLLIDDINILNAISNSSDPKILDGVKFEKDGTVSGKSVASLEKFEEIFKELSDTIASIAENMKSGLADANPHRKGANSPCSYCKMKQICRASQKNMR